MIIDYHEKLEKDLNVIRLPEQMRQLPTFLIQIVSKWK